MELATRNVDASALIHMLQSDRTVPSKIYYLGSFSPGTGQVFFLLLT
jgi:hypothetical protein